MLNIFLRHTIRYFFGLMNLIIRIDQFLTRKTIKSRWNKFKSPDHGIQDFDSQRERLNQYFESLSGKKWWVTTSGTRKEPKKIPYTEARIRDLNKEFLKSMIVLTSSIPGTKTFFAFGSLEKDQSLTSSMIDEHDSPTHPELLQAPYRYLATPEGKRLRALTGDLCARTAILIVTTPRFIYATNPSTLTHFLDELKNNWSLVQCKLNHLLSTPLILNDLLKLQDGNAKERLTTLMLSKDFDQAQLLPELKAVITWDGGYVRSFLNRLMKLLPDYVQHIPMYSMSTETIETLPHRINGKIVFLPTMKGTLPEFLNADGKILKAHELKVNSVYTLIITNNWGLERYDTQDEFKVTAIVDGLPALEFMRRRNMTASLTGEKITEEQVLLLKKMLKDKYPQIAQSSLSLFPVVSDHKAGYQMVIIGQTAIDPKGFLDDAEAYLSEINNEYRDKVKSGRLFPITVESMSVFELATLMGQEHRWESQFKVMPLYEKPVTKNN